MVNALKQLDIKIEDAVCFPGLTVIPILSEKQCEDKIATIFGQAIQNGNLKIQEQKSSNVPRLTVTYEGEGYVLGVKGHLLVGGGQDRQLNHSCVLSKGTYEIPVQCIQQGRWNPNQSKQFTSCNSVTSSGLRFNRQTQQDTWNKIRTYETATNTISGSESYTCTHTITMGDNRQLEEMMRNQSVKTSDKSERVRDKAQKMMAELKQPTEKQIGFLAIQVNPFEWLENKKTETNYLIEITGHSDIWKKLHSNAMESLVYDTAICEMNAIFTIEINDQYQAEIAEFMTMLTVDDWEETDDFIGQENRFQLKSNTYFGEAIYLENNVDSMPIHLISSKILR